MLDGDAPTEKSGRLITSVADVWWVSDPLVPVIVSGYVPAAAVPGEVLARVPERAVVAWVHAHAAVVAPTFEAGGLRTRARDERGLRLHGVGDVTGGVAHVVDGRIGRSARRAEADADVADAVH